MGYGYTRHEFEDLCEKEYHESLHTAKIRINDGEEPGYLSAHPKIWGGGRMYLCFPKSEANLIIDKWNARLDEEIREYQREYNHRKEVERTEREKIKLQKENIEKEQEKREKERKKTLEAQIREAKARFKLQRQMSLKKLMASPYNFESSMAENYVDEYGSIIEDKLTLYLKTTENTKLLMSEPYNMSEEEAKKYICKDGEINKVALTQFENARKNKELIAKKIAEWEAQKAKQTEVTNNNFVCPSCGHPSGINDKFCRACGAAIQKQCPSCKKLLPASCKFCSACGTKL